MSLEQRHMYQLREGDPTSFEYLYNLWSGKLYNFIMRLSRGDTYLAEEIVQLVFLQVWEKRRDIDPEKSFVAYICTIAKNRLVNFYQHRLIEFFYREDVGRKPFVIDHTTEKEIEFRLLEEYINTLIDQLPPARREIFILSRRKFMTNKEIALVLDLSENTVESQISKALAFLRKRLTQHNAG